MSDDGAKKDYRFGAKNVWRRSVWNEVLMRASGREKIAPILYLPGPGDLDRLVATQKGVPSQNMVAIDKSIQNVVAVRADGCPAIKADALSVLRAWPVHRRVAAVLLDFCGGFERGLLLSSEILLRSCFSDSVVMLNFQRGRDPSSNQWRDLLVQDGGSWMLEIAAKSKVVTSSLSLSGKNRALGFVCVKSGLEAAAIAKIHGVGPGPEFDQILHRIFRWKAPWFYSYKSGALVFDSVIFRPLTHVDMGPGRADLGVGYGNGGEIEASMDDSGIRFDPRVAHKIGAMLAVRTRRAASRYER